MLTSPIVSGIFPLTNKEIQIAWDFISDLVLPGCQWLRSEARAVAG